MIHIKKCNKHTDDFQHKMRRDIDKIQKSDKIILKSDTTGNHYSIDAGLYHKTITTEICKF